MLNILEEQRNSQIFQTQNQNSENMDLESSKKPFPQHYQNSNILPEQDIIYPNQNDQDSNSQMQIQSYNESNKSNFFNLNQVSIGERKPKYSMAPIWSETHEENITLGLNTYIKDPSKLIIQSLQSGGQGRVFKGYDKKKNQKIVFKQFKNTQDYEREKKIYQFLQKNIEKIDKFVALDGLEYEDRLNLLIIPCCECNLADLAFESQKKLIENPNNNNYNIKKNNNDPIEYQKLLQEQYRHFSKEEIQYIFHFILQAMAALEDIGIIYQDLKPQNILIKYWQKKGQSKYILAISDFGGAYFKNGDTIQYGQLYTEWFQKQSLKNTLSTFYTQQHICEDFIFALLRTIQYCLYPYFLKTKEQQQQIYFCEKNIDNFTNDLQSNFGLKTNELYQKCISNNAFTFQETNAFFSKIHDQYPENNEQIQGFQQSQENHLKQIKETDLQNKFEQKQQELKAQKIDQITYQINMASTLLETDNILESYQYIKSIVKKLPKINDINLKIQAYDTCAQVYWEMKNLQTATNLYEKTLQLIETHIGKYCPQSSNTLNNLGLLYQQQGQIEKAVQFSEKSLQIEENLFGKNCPQSSSTINNLATLYKDLGQNEKSVQLYEKSLEIDQKTHGQYCLEQAGTLNNLALLFKDLGQPEKAVQYYLKSLEIKEKNHGKGCLQSADTLNNLGSLFNQQGQLEKSVNFYEKSLEIEEKHFGKGCAQSANILNNLGLLYQDLGQNEKAIEFFNNSIEIFKKYYGKFYIQSANPLNNLGIIYMNQGLTEKAIKLFEKSLLLYERNYGKECLQSATIINNLGGLFEDIGQSEKAIQFYNKSLQIDEKYFGKNYFQSADTLNNLGNLFEELGELDKAIGCFERCLEIEEGHFGKGCIQSATTLNNLAAVVDDLGQIEKAIELYEQSLLIKENHFGKGCVQSATTYNNLGLLYKDLGDTENAIRLYGKSLEIKEKFYGQGCSESANVLDNLGDLYEDLGEVEKSDFFYGKSLEIQKQIVIQNQQSESEQSQ